MQQDREKFRQRNWKRLTVKTHFYKRPMRTHGFRINDGVAYMVHTCLTMKTKNFTVISVHHKGVCFSKPGCRAAPAGFQATKCD